jgi:hypothetical protein
VRHKEEMGAGDTWVSSHRREETGGGAKTAQRCSGVRGSTTLNQRAFPEHNGALGPLQERKSPGRKGTHGERRQPSQGNDGEAYRCGQKGTREGGFRPAVAGLLL